MLELLLGPPGGDVVRTRLDVLLGRVWGRPGVVLVDCRNPVAQVEVDVPMVGNDDLVVESESVPDETDCKMGVVVEPHSEDSVSLSGG
jgi:hypothetical protein